MCGIFGIHGRVDKELVDAMSEVLKHRGPDDSGLFLDANVALGNNRLSIIDVKGGHQPIHNEDSTTWITFNGEIYNFQELRAKLENLGHSFYTRSDTEVIVHAYEQWGEDCVKEFNGMWAFAVWDSNKKQLFLSRDRLGIKPLYYFSDGKRFIFASEIKAIILDKSIARMPNDKMIYDYLVYGLVDHTEETFFSGVKRLLPAHNLVLNGSGVRIKKYWDIPFTNKEIENNETNDDVYAQRFLELFEESVRLQLVSEVPVGTCLSGGLDSSSIVCMINRLLNKNSGLLKHSTRLTADRQKTFTACFADKDVDEREYVDEVIAQTEAEKNLISPSAKKLWEDTKKLVYFQEEPFGGTSVYAQWCVMKLASRKVKVVLDGQGGDELLTGYIGYNFAFIYDLLKKGKIIGFIRELLSSLDLIAPYITHYLFQQYPKRAKEIRSLLNESFVSEHASTTKENLFMKYEDLPTLMHTHLTKSNLPALLRFEDKNSMAFSIEARVPFLDHRLVEYISSLPMNQKLDKGWTKRVLRNALKDVLPEKIRKRRKKIAFATPQEKWLMELKKEISEVFASSEFRDRKYFKQREILSKVDAFFKGRFRHYDDFFWRILNLEIWLRVFFDEEAASNEYKYSRKTRYTRNLAV